MITTEIVGVERWHERPITRPPAFSTAVLASCSSVHAATVRVLPAAMRRPQAVLIRVRIFVFVVPLHLPVVGVCHG
jgi:hypothetical protein